MSNQRTTTLARTLLAACAAATLAMAAGTASAQVRGQIVIGNAPPPPRVEAVPAPRPGYHWTPGYWAWQNHRHVWHQGVWVRERRGYAYADPAWVQRGDRYEFRRGGWARRDNDRDGVPNGADHQPNNPYRR
ncbi:MAG TPA: YXWGXW repeat-containing protein [Burkholderiaceae bacterium]|nr:YXWGXW repeat-containing protein [Burkholderiaceae bacterium]